MGTNYVGSKYSGLSVIWINLDDTAVIVILQPHILDKAYCLLTTTGYVVSR